MAGTVTSLLTLITAAEVGDDAGWESIGGGAGSSQDTNIFIQALAARSRRVDNAVSGFSFDQGVSTLNLSPLKTHLGFWVKVTQPALCNTIDLRYGDNTSPTSSFDAHEVINANYPDTGQWLRFWLNVFRVPTTVNNPNMAALRHFGAEFDMGNVGGNANNCQLDRIDFLGGGGIAVVLDAGTVPSPATISDLVTADEGTTANKYGVIQTRDGINYFNARVGIGDATLTIFNDSGGVIVFADQGFVQKDWLGLTIDLGNTGTDIDFAGYIFRSGGSINLGDFKVINVAGSAACDFDACTWDTIRRIFLLGVVNLTGGCIVTNSGQIDPTNGDYSGSMDLPSVDEYVDTTTNLDLNTASGDFEIIMYINMTDWTPASAETIVSHYGGTIATESFRLQVVNSTGTILRLIVSDGSTETTLDSTVFSILPDDGHWRWVRVKYDQSAGQADFFWSQDPTDTTVGDISWTAQGTPTGVSRLIPTNSRPVLLGAENDGTPTGFMDGEISYFEIWTDGFRQTGAGEGNLILRADWRVGPDFTGSPSIRADDFATSIDWEEQGTTPIYTTADNNTTAADLDGVIVTDSTSVAALAWNINTDPNGELDNMTFNSSGTGHAIVLGPNTPSTITLTNHDYNGYVGIDGSTGNETIYNNSGKEITINVASGGGTPTIRNGTGASTTVSNTVTLTVHVEDEAEANIEGAAVYMQKTSPTLFTSGVGNNAGDADLVVTQTIDVDQPGTGTVIVLDISLNVTLPYRYASHDGANTFTFITEVTGAATSTDGTNPDTKLISTSTNFLTADIVEGDTIRNTTDGSFAVVDRIVDADNITTSILQGGTNNEWRTGDSFSLHRLATTLISGTDTVDATIISDFTNASGDVTKSFNFNSNTDVIVRTRKNSPEDSTRFIQGRASGTITSAGTIVNVSMQEDTVVI